MMIYMNWLKKSRNGVSMQMGMSANLRNLKVKKQKSDGRILSLIL